MAAVTAPTRGLPEPSGRGASAGRRFLDRLERLPVWLVASLALIVALGLSTFLRTRYIGNQFWEDEALSVGISTHSLASIPSVLRHDGSPPLFYLMLHVWMSAFGSSVTSTHVLSLIWGLLTIPAGAGLAWSLWGRWPAAVALVLFAMNPFLTAYSQETRMYTLMVFLGLLATAGFIHGFLFRRRRYLILFTVCQALMLYTHAWGIFFGIGAGIAFLVLLRASDEPRALLRDGLMAFGAAAVLFLPWVPTLLYQAAHTGSPWDSAPNFGAPVQISRNLMGGDRATMALVLGTALGLAALLVPRRWRSRESLIAWVLVAIPVGTLGFGWVVSHVSPAWAYRYFAPVVGSMLLLGALGLSRAKGIGVIALMLVIVFWANPTKYAPQYKSDMRDVAGEMSPMMHRGDLVILGQPDQVPLAWYYLPAGLRYASTTGPSKDPQSMYWVSALSRLQRANPQQTLNRLIASLKPNQQVLYLRPLTEGAQNWQAPWTELVRRRSAQWGALLSSDRSLKPVAWAPHSYQGSCCVADSAILYRKL